MLLLSIKSKYLNLPNIVCCKIYAWYEICNLKVPFTQMNSTKKNQRLAIRELKRTTEHNNYHLRKNLTKQIWQNKIRKFSQYYLKTKQKKNVLYHIQLKKNVYNQVHNLIKSTRAQYEIKRSQILSCKGPNSCIKVRRSNSWSQQV